MTFYHSINQKTIGDELEVDGASVLRKENTISKKKVDTNWESGYAVLNKMLNMLEKLKYFPIF